MDIDPQPITNWFLLVLAVVGTITALSGVVYKVNRNFEKRVTELITETTKQIQPLANGGVSLTDLHHKIDRIDQNYRNVLHAQEDQREAWHARYVRDQTKIRQEWVAVFAGIKSMIHMPPEQQAEMWDRITEAYANGTIVEPTTEEML